MFSALEVKCLEDIEIIKFLIDYHSDLSKYNPKHSQKIKVFTVSSCVTRLYALYENFVETAMSDYLDSLTECVTFSALTNEFKSEYRLGISYILGKIDQGRYTSLSHENIIKWYHEALSDNTPYTFVTPALTRHDQNLRLNIVESLFNRIQLRDLPKWLSNHPEIKGLYQGEESIYTQLEAEVKNFIQLRNDASHGALDSLEGHDNLYRLCDLTKALVLSISAFLRKSLIIHMKEAGLIAEIGFVTESFKSNGAFVAKVKEGTEVKLGKVIYLLDSSNCYSQPITSIMLNNNNVGQVIAQVDDLEVGIKCDRSVKVKSKLFAKSI